MTSFDLDQFYFANTVWTQLPLFLEDQNISKNYNKNVSLCSNPANLLFSKKSFSIQSASKGSSNLNESLFKFQPELDFSNILSQSCNSIKTNNSILIPSQLNYLQNLVKYCSSSTLRYHPRFPLPDLLELILSQTKNLSSGLNDNSFTRTILKISPIQNTTQSLLRNILLGSFTPVDPITLKHSRATNLSEISLTILVSDVALDNPQYFSFWNRLVSTREIQNLGSAPFSICSIHNTQIFCLSPIESSKSSTSDYFNHFSQSPCITIPNFKKDQLEYIFTKFINISISQPNMVPLSPQADSFVNDFSETLSPFLADLYFSPNLKDNFHFSVSDPKIFSILKTLCDKINIMRKSKSNFSSGSIVNIFKQVFRQSNIIQESAATILYNSSVFLFKSISSSLSSQNILFHSQLAKAVNNLSKDKLYKHLFKHISFGNYSNEIIDQISDLTKGTWIYSGPDSSMKIQHLLISGYTYLFKIANPESIVSTCDQMKLILCSVLEDRLRNWDNERVVILLKTTDMSKESDSQIFFHVISNSHFHLLFSRREIKDYCKRLYKNRRLSSKKPRNKSSNEVPLVDLFNDFLKSVISFCIWEFNETFKKKRRLFQSFPRVDMKSFSEFIETNFIKNQILECTELYTFLKKTLLPLSKTTGKVSLT
jgi:hypothetical protein